MAEAQHSSGGGRFKLFFASVVILGMLGVIAYLAGQLNAHRFYLVREDRNLVVHRGAPIPFVTRPFLPRNQAERTAYAPILVASNVATTGRQSFSDRAALDRAIYALMDRMLRDEFYTGRLPNMERVDAYMARIDHLTGLSDDDRRTLETLRGDYAYLKAQELLEGLPGRLREARRMCDLAERQGTGKLGDPRLLSQRVGTWMQVLSQASLTGPVPPTAFAEPRLEESTPPPVAVEVAPPVGDETSPAVEPLVPERSGSSTGSF